MIKIHVKCQAQDSISNYKLKINGQLVIKKENGQIASVELDEGIYTVEYEVNGSDNSTCTFTLSQGQIDIKTAVVTVDGAQSSGTFSFNITKVKVKCEPGAGIDDYSVSIDLNQLASPVNAETTCLLATGTHYLDYEIQGNIGETFKVIVSAGVTELIKVDLSLQSVQWGNTRELIIT